MNNLDGKEIRLSDGTLVLCGSDVEDNAVIGLAVVKLREIGGGHANLVLANSAKLELEVAAMPRETWEKWTQEQVHDYVVRATYHLEQRARRDSPVPGRRRSKADRHRDKQLRWR